jgi:glycosyltransferase involved in cell wall biosynthesis
MRIVHVVHQYPPDFVGGTELYTQSLAQLQAKTGHAVAVFAPTSRTTAGNDAERTKNYHEYRPLLEHRSALTTFGNTFRSTQLGQSFAEVITNFKPELVHIQHLMGLPANLSRQLEQEDIPFVVTLHDYWYLCANAQLLTNDDLSLCDGPDLYLNCARCSFARIGLPLSRYLSPVVAPLFAWRNRILKPILDNARWIIIPTKFIGQIYQQLDLNSNRYRFIPLGIPLPGTPIKPNDPVPGKLRITYIGGLSWQKGVHILIDAVNTLPHDRVRLFIYGDLKAYPDYSKDLIQLADSDGISFQGMLKRKDLWSALADSDVVVVPSIWYENSPATVREAFAAKVPVIASEIGGLQEQIKDGIDGILFPPGDIQQLREILITLLENPQRLIELQKGIGQVRSIEEHALDIEKLYKSTIND